MDREYRHFDAEELERRFGRDSLQAILQIYFEESPSLNQEFLQAFQTEDLARLADVTHSLKGSLGMLCATGLSSLAEEITALCETGSGQRLTEQCEALTAGLRGLTQELEALQSTL